MATPNERTMGRTALAAVTIGYLVWSLLPLASTALSSFDRGVVGARWEGFSVRWWSPWSRSSIFRDHDIAMAARHTAQLALVSTTIAVVLGTALALGIRHLPRRAAIVVYALLVLTIAFPAVALGGSLWIVFAVPFRHVPFGEFGWFGTRAQTAGLATFELPFVVLIVSAWLASIPFEQEEMAADLGAPPTSVVGRVLLAQLWPAIGAAALVAFTIGMGEFVITDALRSTDDTRTLSSSFFSRDPSPMTDALATAVAVAGFAASAAVLAVMRLSRLSSSRN